MNGPVIGITCGENTGTESFFLRRYYVQGLAAAGGVPVLLPPVGRKYYLKKLSGILDGLVLSGGVDVDPIFFGEEPLLGAGEITPVRDEFELELIWEFFKTGKSVLGICRGLQVLNIAMGGTVFQDLTTQVPGVLKHIQEAPKWYATHWVTVSAGTKIGEILPAPRWRVNSFHHQAVSQAAPGLLVSARAQDGVIEALESEEHSFIVGVQWHPECNWHRDVGSFRLFQEFIRACKN